MTLCQDPRYSLLLLASAYYLVTVGGPSNAGSSEETQEWSLFRRAASLQISHLLYPVQNLPEVCIYSSDDSRCSV